MLKLRNYQKDCIDIIEKLPNGSYLVQMATGLGKTATFANIPRKGRVLVLAHREELVRQPIKYYDCPVGIEMAGDKSNGEEVVLASVQSIVQRLDQFDKNEFDMIITDEAHHAAAKTYKKIYSYFNPRLHLGFTATPNRGDKVRLDDVFSKIVFQKDIKWAINNKYLCDIHCLRVNIGYDLSKVAKHMGDFSTGQLEEAMNLEQHNKAIAQAYREYGKGQTLIFGTTIQHCKDIAKEIPGAIAVTSETKDRADLIERFTNREIPVLVNCMLFTEGTDIPLVETIIIARPTQNSSLYTQMVGRGLRLHADKEKLILIDCVGATGKNNICTAPSLIGIDLKDVPKSVMDEIEGDLFDLPDLIVKKSDTPESWIRNIEIVNLWSQEQNYNTHDINFFKLPTGDLILKLDKKNKFRIPAQDELGMTTLTNNETITMQEAIDRLYCKLNTEYQEFKYIWDLAICRRWGKQEASEKQIKIINRRLKEFDTNNLSKLEASQILNRLYA